MRFPQSDCWGENDMRMKIRESVGKGGKNRPADVAIIQDLFRRDSPGSISAGIAPRQQNFLAAVKSRNSRDLHDELNIAYLSASMCHLANISYRVGRKLTLQAGPNFLNDPEANKLLTRDYRKPYVV